VLLGSVVHRGNFAQFEEMYDQRRREVNKQFEKFEKQLRAAKSSGKNAKQNADKVRHAPLHLQSACLPACHVLPAYACSMCLLVPTGAGLCCKDRGQAQQGPCR
jgi:hypothetical protein